MSTRDTEKIKSLAKEVVQECYSDKDFMDRLCDKFLAAVTKKITEEIEKQLNVFQEKSKKNMQEVKNEIKSLEVQLNKVYNENQSLRKKIQDVEKSAKIVPSESKIIIRKLNDLEQKTKITELRFLGLKEEKGENLNKVLTDCFKEKMGINQILIDNCYRTGKRANQGDKPRPVYVKFVSMSDRNIIFNNKKKLKGSKISIVEELTRERLELLKQAKVAFGKQNVWTRSGRIYTKLNDTIYSMKYLEELESILKIQREQM